MATPQKGTGKVVLNYRDYAYVTEEDPENVGEQKPGRCSDTNFPVRLHFMLSNLEKDGLDRIISWQPHGRCFVVHKQEEFVQQILPQ